MQGLMSSFPLTLPHVFHRAERLFGDKRITSVMATGERQRTTYAKWADRTRRLAGALDDLGISEDGRVATFAWNSGRHLELYFAAPCSGRVLHTLNIRLFPEQLRYIVDHAEDEVIFADRSLMKLLAPHLDSFSTVRHIVVLDDGAGEVPDDDRIVDYEELIGSAVPAEFADGDEWRAAAMCYTSGTTGNPKGTVYTHRSTVLHCLGAMLADTLAVSERDVVLPVVPMFHANAWGLGQAGVMAGSDFVMPGADLSPRAIADLMETEGVTLAAGVPTIWIGVLDELEGREFPALDRILCGGSAVPRSLSEAYRERLGMPILHAWGMTETSPIGSIARMRSNHLERPQDKQAEIRSSQGVPSPLFEIRIVEPESGQVLPWDGDASGELQARGPWVAAAYYEDERSAESFTPDGWLRTGDVATISPEGYIRLVDRTKDMVKSGGEWISSVELENEIMAHPKVREAAVIALPDARWGERPCACVVAEPGADIDADEVRDFLEGRVARWWIPERIEFIEEVPKTSVGKFSKKTLRERYVAEGPGGGAPAEASASGD